jgi:hypothetical protein
MASDRSCDRRAGMRGCTCGLQMDDAHDSVSGVSVKAGSCAARKTDVMM